MSNEFQTDTPWGPLALMAGLSILSNNDGRMNTGQLIARGGLDALGALRARKQYDAAMERQRTEDERAAQEWQWKVDDRNRKRSLEERFLAGDEEAFRILYPEQYYMGKRQEAAHKHALDVLRRQERLAQARKTPAFSPVEPQPATAEPVPAVPSPEPSPAMPEQAPTVGAPAVPSGPTIPTLSPELGSKMKRYTLGGIPSHASTESRFINEKTGEADPTREFPRAPTPVPLKPSGGARSVPSHSAKQEGDSGFTGGSVYDFEGNEVRANGDVKWGKQGEIHLPNGRKVIGQLDPTGNYFRYFGDVEQGGGKQLSASTVEVISGNFAMMERLRSAGETARENPDATGPIKGFVNDRLPSAVLDWFDKDGVVSRAKIAELSSSVIKDRSGANVTAAEFPRLKPFIPQIGDSPETVQTKLREFYRIVQEETNLYLESLRSSGYDVPEIMFDRGIMPFSAEGTQGLDKIWNGGR